MWLGEGKQINKKNKKVLELGLGWWQVKGLILKKNTIQITKKNTEN
jgi:hypothetical protein